LKYNVHVYPIMRVHYKGIEANSPEEAVRKANDLFGTVDPQFNPKAFGEQAIEAELASGFDGFLVDPLDEKGEVIYEQAVHFEPDGETRSATLQEARP
jgi:hypothetical protein